MNTKMKHRIIVIIFLTMSLTNVKSQTNENIHLDNAEIGQRNEQIAFLLRAKRATYAGHGTEVASSRPSSHDLRYEETPYLYIDTYLGETHFAGEEAMWKDGTPIWSMNYYGQVIGEGFEGDFLKEALYRATPEAPYRGPELFTKGEFTYRCVVHGEFTGFNGEETIEKNGKVIYHCQFHGGKIR